MTGPSLRTVAALALTLLLAGCAQPTVEPSSESGTPIDSPPIARAEIAPRLLLSLEVASDTLIAGEEIEVAITISNEGAAAVQINDSGPSLWITDSDGKVVLEPRFIRHPMLLVPLTPGQMRTEAVTFTVPPEGEYSIQSTWQVGNVTLVGDGRTPPFWFTSVAP